MSLKDRILDYRAKYGLSQAKMAKRCGITMTTLSNIERGIQTPSRLTEAKIERVLDGKEEIDAIIDQQNKAL